MLIVAIICTPLQIKQNSTENGYTADGGCNISNCKKGAAVLGYQKYKFELNRNC